jgi:hypothetical protein
MEPCRIIVFGTSDLSRATRAHVGQKPVYQEVWRRQMLRWYSTGRLEQALTLGSEICVCTVRPIFGKHDDWWRALVPPERVFAPQISSGMTQASFREALLFEPWRRFFAYAGLAWPNDGRDGLDVRGDLDGSLGVLYGGRLSGFSGAA